MMEEDIFSLQINTFRNKKMQTTSQWFRFLMFQHKTGKYQNYYLGPHQQ
jgi:hypothetical protein